MPRFRVILLVALTCFSAMAGESAEANDQPYRVGLLTPNSGLSSAPGAAFTETIRYLEQQINERGGVDGHPIHIFGPYEEAELKASGQEGRGRVYSDSLVFDTRSTPQGTRDALKELKRKDALAIIGPLLSENVRAAADIVKDEGPVLVVPNAGWVTMSPSDRWIFGTGISPQLYAARAVKHIKIRAYGRIGIVFHPTGVSAATKDEIRRLAHDYGVRGVKELAIPLNGSRGPELVKGLGNTGTEAILSTVFPGAVPHLIKERKALGSIPLIQVLAGSYIERQSGTIRDSNLTGGKVIAPVMRIRIVDESSVADPQAQTASKLRTIWDTLKYPGWQISAFSSGKLRFTSYSPYVNPSPPMSLPNEPRFEPLAGETSPKAEPGGQMEYLSWITDKPATRLGIIEFSAAAHDAFMLIVDALKSVGPDKEKIRDHIEHRKGFVGAVGTYNYSPTDHQGLTDDVLVMAEFSKGKWKLLEK